MRLVLSGFLAAALSVQPAYSREWPTVEGWVIAGSDDSCGMHLEYEGKGATELVLLLSLDGTVGLSLSNSGWSAVEDQKYEMEYHLNGKSYSGGAAVGSVSSYKKGFVATFGDEFAKDFAVGSTLAIYRGELLVDKLSVKGTSAAVAMVRRCVESLRAEKAAADREARRLAHIANDPFAAEQSAAAQSRFGPAAPALKGNPGSWMTYDDYPALALRERRTGETKFKVNVGDNGGVISCAVTSSSGHSDLDDATCKIISRRARFTGGGVYESKMVWKIPE